jgi:hypothetical protein
LLLKSSFNPQKKLPKQYKNMINVSELYVTQNGLRNLTQLEKMTHYVSDGGFFTQNCLSKNLSRGRVSPLIEITLFEDGKHFIHDGHHRSASIVLGGRDFLDSTEYRIRNFNYEHYLEINLSASWMTPFDPRVEVRLANIFEYKTNVNALINEGSSNDDIFKYITENKHLYAEFQNEAITLLDFAGSLKQKININ